MADQVADLLNEMGIEYRYVADYPVEEIVRNNSEGQVRIKDHLAPPKLVAQYAHQMEQGAQFPPIVICKRTKEVADGNTRLAAKIKTGSSTVPAYVADFPDLSVRMFFAGRSNQQGGLRLDSGEAKALAIMLLQEGTEPEQISLGLGISVDEARKYANEVEARERLLLAGLEADKIDSLEPSVLSRLNNLKMNSILLAQAQFAIDAGLKTGQNSKFVTSLNKLRSEDDALHLITNWRKEYAPSIKKVKAGVGTKKPGAIACISLAHANLMKRTLKEYEIEINGNVSESVIKQIQEISERAERLVEILTKP